MLCRLVRHRAAMSSAARLLARSMSSEASFVVDEPFSGKTHSIAYHSPSEVAAAVDQSHQAQKAWRQIPLSARQEATGEFIEGMREHKEEVSTAVSLQTGKPLPQALGEFDTMIARSEAILAVSHYALANEEFEEGKIPRSHCVGHIEYEPVGVVAALCPWNYPLLCSVFPVVAGVLAGNSVLVKHSERTDQVASFYQQVWQDLCDRHQEREQVRALIQQVRLPHERIPEITAHPRVGFVSFVGSVEGGQAVQSALHSLGRWAHSPVAPPPAASEDQEPGSLACCPDTSRFPGYSLELGSNDAALMCEDMTVPARLTDTVTSLLDGAFYNNGQSCCAVERIYIPQQVFPKVQKEVERQMKAALEEDNVSFGDPLGEDTVWGPMASPAAVQQLADRVSAVTEDGSVSVLAGTGAGFAVTEDGSKVPVGTAGSHGRFFCPTVLEVTEPVSEFKQLGDGARTALSTEWFGPVVTLVPLATTSDEATCDLINHSPYGLTASVWTEDNDRFTRLGRMLDVGTVFQNRSDFVDPHLPWSGRKWSGVGSSYSARSFNALVRPKSYNRNVLEPAA